MCASTNDCATLLPQPVDDVLPDGRGRGVIRFRFCASKSGRFNKLLHTGSILVFDISMYEFDTNQFRSRSFSSHEYTELGFNKTPSRSLKVKICEYETFTVLHSITHPLLILQFHRRLCQVANPGSTFLIFQKIEGSPGNDRRGIKMAGK